jgi:hypothetical protein
LLPVSGGAAVINLIREIRTEDGKIVGHCDFVALETCVAGTHLIWHDWISALYTLLFIICGEVPWATKSDWLRSFERKRGFIDNHPESVEAYVAQHALLRKDAARAAMVKRITSLLAQMGKLTQDEAPDGCYPLLCKEIRAIVTPPQLVPNRQMI